MKRLLLPFFAGFLASCSSPKPLPAIPIPKAAPVAPAVANIRPGLDRASDAAAALKARGESLERIAAKAKADAAAHAAEARRLADAGAATQQELDHQAEAAATQRDTADRLASELEAEKADKEKLSQALEESRIAQADALAAASQGDSAVNMLTQQVGALHQQVIDADKVQKQAEKDARDLGKDLAVERDRRRLWLRLALAGWGLIVGYIALRLLAFYGRISFRLP